MSEKKKAGVTFTKQQFLKSANFTSVQKDVLRTLLKDDETYTLDHVKQMVEDFAKRTVK